MKVEGKRCQQVDIYYNTIGLWYAPEPEEMKRLFQEYLAEKQQKTAQPLRRTVFAGRISI